ncbi:MAG: CmcI family methyltransferase [Phycisphaeraceae bacterium]
MATIDTVPQGIALGDDDLRTYHVGHADRDNAGQGLVAAPFLAQVIGGDAGDVRQWLMSPAEQMAMIYLLDHLRPKVAIEIGTRFGGSLQVLAKYARQVYSLDIDPEVPARLAGRFDNVEFIIGSSRDTLPALLQRLEAQGVSPEFCLVDGDHSDDGVRADIDNLLRVVPRSPMAIVMHDSFNPDCRRGLCQADWAGNPFVHMVELDFVSGVVNPAPATRGQLWGGLALGFLKPERRQGELEVTGRAELTFQVALTATLHKSPLSHPKTAARRLWRVATGAPIHQ